ncbi:hypothetical protein WA026_012099 [Henosepilachna vigintioctopunctata]|uniref:HMG box domain-containing protein n=1 Tax=Henosepilachna vigintioctopunctata TaxID=420089 RepID=A0AAW1VCJ9_9CUCU
MGQMYQQKKFEYKAKLYHSLVQIVSGHEDQKHFKEYTGRALRLNDQNTVFSSDKVVIIRRTSASRKSAKATATRGQPAASRSCAKATGDPETVERGHTEASPGKQRQQGVAAPTRHQQRLNNHNNLHHHHSILQQQQQLQHQLPPVATEERMLRAKGDVRPNGSLTASAFFVQIWRQEHKKKHPEENVVSTGFSRKCAERWKTMLDVG